MALAAGAVLLVDLRHPPSKLDRQLKEWLDHFGCPTVIAATKADKIGASRRQRHLNELVRELPVAEGQTIIPYSARTGFGKDRLWTALKGLLWDGG